MYQVEIVCDSISPTRQRLTTMVATYPLMIHAEMLTHRSFARNAQSNRAIPTQKAVERLWEDPVIPAHWGKNQPGMQAGEALEETEVLETAWRDGMNRAAALALYLNERGVHKQIANRPLTPYQWVTAIYTGDKTAWANFFSLRCHVDAQPEIQKIAFKMGEAYYQNIPREVGVYDWHLPFFTEQDRLEIPDEVWPLVSAARCARVSYLNHGGGQELEKDIDLAKRLIAGAHWSPFEHVAKESREEKDWVLFGGWQTYRHMFPYERTEVFSYDEFLARFYQFRALYGVDVP
jgi:thymidylate synthase ThyX